jgi:hypothetical protein
MRLFVHIRCRGRASGLRPLRTAALAVAALLAGAGAAVAQSAATGVSVYWNALTQSAKPASGLAVDWSALDALRPAPTEAPAAIVLHPPPKPRVAVVAAPKPAEKPAIAAPKPVAPALATAPPRAPSPPRAESAAPPPSATAAMPAAAPALMPGRISMVRYAKGQSQLAANGKARLQLVAYASGSGGDAIEARRIALARAVQLRAYLVEKGVQSVRMDVRALGNRNAGDGPADRVDLVIVDR